MKVNTMRNRIYPVLTLFVILGNAGCTSLHHPLTFDPQVTRGRLENGITYYIRHNEKPSGRLELRLVVNAGSVLEEDDQQGLAHFAEHMAFNGMKNFDKQELVDYLESIGMRFGPDLNAYTSFDETVYMLQVPVEDPEIVDTAFQILRDWAFAVKNEDEEIEKERGVVIEEWRRRRGAAQRIRDKQLPVLFTNSQYASRLPIGKKEILDRFPPARVRDFYEDWYRPDLMSIIAVGDMDPQALQVKIAAYFGTVPPEDGVCERTTFHVPDHDETFTSLVTDPEAASSSVSIYYKRDVDPLLTKGDYRRVILEDLFNGMLNQRFDELRRQPDPPFLSAYSYKGAFIRAKEFFVLGAQVEDNGYLRGLETLLTEAERIKRYGFTASELKRTKDEALRDIQQAYNERETTESRVYARAYIRNHLRRTVSPGVEAELKLHKKYLAKTSLEEINDLVADWLTDHNRVILASGPEKLDVEIPSEQEVLRVFEDVAQKEIPPYVDDSAGNALIAAEPVAGTITAREVIAELGVTMWTLSNGAKMILKPTPFKEDQILFKAFSPGGHSLVSDDIFIPAASADGVIQQCGLGDFSKIQLRKKLAGKIVSVTPFIDELQEGLQGGCTPDALETLFQLVHLHFTRPRGDPEAFQSYTQRTAAALENRLARPEAVFADTVQTTMSCRHPRRQPWTPDTVSEFDLEKSLAVYRDRFAHAGDFTFLFVGNFSLKRMERLARHYLAGLPPAASAETWQDLHITYPEGAVKEIVKKGLEEKSQVNIIFTGPLKWEYAERYKLNSLLHVLRIRLREELREEMGGTYHVGISPKLTHYPTSTYEIVIGFGCAPDQVEAMIATVFAETDKIKSAPIEDIYLTKVKQSQLRKREIDLETNEFWHYVLSFYAWHGEDPLILLDFEEHVERLSKEDIQHAANHYFATGNIAQFILLPDINP